MRKASTVEPTIPEPPSNPSDAEVLGGRYRLEALLGAGGMAVVWRGLDLRLDRHVAVKVIGNAPLADDGRFALEMRTLASFDHPNLVRLLDADVEKGWAYLVMDLVEGPNLAERCRGHRLNEAEVARIGTGIAAALAYVHSRGVIHRDVKPANVLLGPEERPRLADFGIARLVDSAGLTSTGQILGTPAYLAPEQVSGGDVGPPADIYALGLVLAECLTGTRIYRGSPAEVAAARLYTDPFVSADMPAGWGLLLGSMTARVPAHRPSAVNVMAALAALPDPTAVIATDTSSADTINEPAATAVPQVTETFDTARGAALAPVFIETRALDNGTGDTMVAPAAAPAGGARGGGGPESRRFRRGLWLTVAAVLFGASVATALAAGSLFSHDPTRSSPRSTTPSVATPAPTTSIAPPTSTALTTTTTTPTSTTATTTPHRKKHHRHRPPHHEGD